MTERDIRTELLNTLLTTSHRDLAQLHSLHQTLIGQDPRFCVHLVALEDVTDARIKGTGRITRSTALQIDKSGSMEVALEVGRQLGALISAICAVDLSVCAFDTAAYSVQVKGATLADWEKALAGIHAGGGTSCGVALGWMRRKGQRVEQMPQRRQT